MEEIQNMSNSSTVQADRTERVYVTSILFRFIIVFLITFIIVMFLLILGILRNLPYIPDDVRTVILETLVCQNCQGIGEEEELNGNSEGVKNRGWSLFKYPEYGFSIEIPLDIYSDSSYEEELLNEFTWSIKALDLENAPYYENVFDNYLKTILISLSNQYGQTKPMCDESCQGEVYINIDFYENKNSVILEDIEEEFTEKLKDNEEYLLKNINKFGTEVFTYEYMGNDVVKKIAYILLTKDHIVLIREESNVEEDNSKVMERVLGSIIFE